MYIGEQKWSEIRPVATEYFSRLSLLFGSRGKTWTVKYVKMTRLAVTRFISGEPIDHLPGLKVRDGWPMWVNCLKPLLQDKICLKVLLTLLTVLRDLQDKPILDVQPITDTWKGALPSVTRGQHRTICKELGIGKRSVEWRRYHMSTKKGPNGQAIWSSVFDLSALPDKLIKDITLIAGSPLRKHMDEIRSARWDSLSLADVWLTLFPLERDKQLRKLSYFSDKEGKTRVIAILDYWSQTALKPVHDAITSILRGIRTDCTFNQNRFLEILPQGDNITYHSLDLSNATDRMPLAFQKKVLGSIIGYKRSEAWGDILTEWPYPCREYPLGVKYQAGQPMGAYSSWPAMALTHHYIVKLAALRVGKTNFWNYCLLGDDIVIADTSVANEYTALLGTLDMPISVAKTHTSKKVYEFAKRWVYQGEEITAFSIGGLLESWHKYPYLYNFLENQEAHGWRLPKDRHPELVRRLYTFMGKGRTGQSTQKLYMIFGALSEMKKVGVFNSSGYKMLEQYLGFPILPEDEATLITNEVIKEARIQMLQSDMESYESGLLVGLTNINNLFSKNFPGLDAPAYRQLNRSHMPLIMAVNDKVDDSMDTLCLLFDPDTPIEILLGIEGLGKYSISKDVFFNLRDSRAILLAFSRLVKIFINGCKTRVNNRSPDN